MKKYMIESIEGNMVEFCNNKNKSYYWTWEKFYNRFGFDPDSKRILRDWFPKPSRYNRIDGEWYVITFLKGEWFWGVKKYMMGVFKVLIPFLYSSSIKKAFSEFYSEEQSVNGTDCLQVDLWGNINPYCQGEFRSQHTYVYRNRSYRDE